MKWVNETIFVRYKPIKRKLKRQSRNSNNLPTRSCFFNFLK